MIEEDVFHLFNFHGNFNDLYDIVFLETLSLMMHFSIFNFMVEKEIKNKKSKKNQKLHQTS